MKTVIRKNRNTWLTALGGAALLATGCETVTRENIVSSIDTGVGASITENKQTQMYELKAGYIRSQFYSVPTGKIVKNEKAQYSTGTNTEHDIRTNAANITPEVVSGIRMHSGLQDLLLGMDVSENFAVGKEAVKSEAATAMYIANAKDGNTAKAASDAVQGVDSGAATSQYITSTEHQKTAVALSDLLEKNLTSDQIVGNKTFKQGTPAMDYADALAADKKATLFTIENKPSRAADLQDVITKLKIATK